VIVKGVIVMVKKYSRKELKNVQENAGTWESQLMEDLFATHSITVLTKTAVSAFSTKVFQISFLGVQEEPESTSPSIIATLEKQDDLFVTLVSMIVTNFRKIMLTKLEKTNANNRLEDK